VPGRSREETTRILTESRTRLLFEASGDGSLRLKSSDRRPAGERVFLQAVGGAITRGTGPLAIEQSGYYYENLRESIAAWKRSNPTHTSLRRPPKNQ